MMHRKLKVEELHRLDLPEYRKAEPMPLTVVLDNVRSLYNVGSVLRTADAYRVGEVWLCGITCAPKDGVKQESATDGTHSFFETRAGEGILREIHKTALGAELSVASRYFGDTKAAIQALKEQGYTVLAVEQAEQSLSLPDFCPEKEKKYAVVFGHEVKGVQQEVIDASDGCLELPQYGTKHSLNVSVTAGIVIWHFARHFYPGLNG